MACYRRSVNQGGKKTGFHSMVGGYGAGTRDICQQEILR